VTLKSTQGDVTVGTAAAVAASAADADAALSGGDAGDGGSGEYGGAGGEGGGITLSAAKGTLTLHPRPGLLYLGNGGNGGDGTIETTNPAEVASHGDMNNDGGRSGWLTAEAATLAGGNPAEAAGEAAEQSFPLSMVSGGKGGDGGDSTYVVLPSATTSSAVRTRALPGDKKVEVGGDGDDGWQTGSDGGRAVCDLGDSVGADNTNGMSAEAVGGNAGNAGDSIATYLPLPWKDGDQRGGKGGDAKAVGGKAGKATGDHKGPKGGDAKATGGEGGDAYWGSNDRVCAMLQAGGHANAKGGEGGAGGSCCPYRETGPAGGQGGTAKAFGGNGGKSTGTSILGYIGNGGNANAEGGNGGKGGTGVPGGPGGTSGSRFASRGKGCKDGEQTEKWGAPGPGGDSCPGTGPPVVPPDGAGGQTKPNTKVTGRERTQTTSAGVYTADWTADVTSDDEGYYVIGNVPAGTHQIFPDPAAAAPPYYFYPHAREVTKVAGVALTGVDFEYRTGGQYTVTVPVRDQTGAPAPGIAVVLEDMWASMVAPKYATSGANGNAVFTDVWSRWYNVSASAIAPVGYYWRALNFYVTDSNVTTDPLQLVAE